MHAEKISRPMFTSWLAKWYNKDVIKVVTGIRRCGKTMLFELFKDELRTKGIPEKQIISINFESPFLPDFPTWRTAWNFIKAKVDPTLKTYIFLDEVQLVPDFERLVDGIYSLKNFDVYITGSNAKFLSGELATFLTGRYVEIRLQPLSFAEYSSLFPKQHADDIMRNYMAFGGFPFAALLDANSQSQTDYLTGILDTIVYKDIIARNGYRDVATLRRLVKFLADNIGNLYSVNKIVGTLKNEGLSVPHATLDAYTESLCETYLFDRVSRYNIKGRDILRTNAKYYLADTGLRRLLLADKPSDQGRILENIIYLELKRRYREVFVGTLGANEIDFVARENAIPHYYQVALTTREESTLLRELAPLKAIRDNHPKTLLTLDRDPPANFDGIKKINAIDFLLDPKSIEPL